MWSFPKLGYIFTIFKEGQGRPPISVFGLSPAPPLSQSLLKTSLDDVNFSLEQFLLKLNNLLDIHAPFKYLKRKNEKHNKPWITNAILYKK